MTSDRTTDAPVRGAPVQHRSASLDVTLADCRETREVHVTVRPLPGEKPSGTVRRLVSVLREHEAVVARHEVFGALTARGEVIQALQTELGDVDWPITFVEGASCGLNPLAGMHVFAVAGTPVESLRLNDRLVGRVFSDHWARHVLLGDVGPNSPQIDKAAQSRQMFDNLVAALHAGRMTFANVARTWFFLDDILSWYGPFNAVRTGFFREHGVFEQLVPASTGVSGRNVERSAGVCGAWASEPLNGAFTMREIKSPRQCPAPNYGSSFSRAVELGTPALRRLMVSGTASIAPGGESVSPDDLEAQIDLTMDVIRAILVSRSMDFSDGSRVTAYFKRPEYAAVFDQWRARLGLAEWPVVYAVADICRDELLFELEIDALAAAGPPPA